MRVLLYVGPLRPRMKPDQARRLIDRIRKSRHRIVGVILCADDPLMGAVRRLGVPVMVLPGELTLPCRVIRERMRTDKAVRRTVEQWVDRLKPLKPDVGVVFFGHWLPPILYRLPPKGFLNYHPAPLPDLRGMEPDTMAVLQGRRTMRGTVHQVTEAYDDGPIFAYTRRMRLTRYTTPREIFETLTAYGVDTIVRVLDRMERGTAAAVPQKEHHEQDATRKQARKESVIRLTEDDVEAVQRRRRAFLGQDIGIRLKAEYNGALHVIEDVETYAGAFPGLPGQYLGAYKGSGPFRDGPIVRLQDGVAVLRPGAAMKQGANSRKDPAASWVMPPGYRRRRTDRRTVERSVDQTRNRR